ncbi:hypothetical protein GIB67_029173 [Kingdonia uniflora]|uniref:B box-type domain-containing protein n=1 Tax=Kingdonia uniflora TaxID=39325 RepID=A0A7J7LSB9_9MAGN|nr:hypothetical protein GIB67_029173 [Kingdonia uniflora]
MKIQCDVCNKEEAAVFCSADEAALCASCDHRVHHANKLASKHHRFSLLHPSSEDVPRCDVCQERRAFLFCKEDRAILCRECDLPIHTANEHTKTHNRFLLTGVKLSSSSTTTTAAATSTTTTLSSSNGCNHPPVKKKDKVMPVSDQPVQSKGGGYIGNTIANGRGSGSTSSISEYLIEMLPGWHVEDLLDSSAPSHGFNKNDVGSLFFDIKSNTDCFSSKDLAIWVPQAPPPRQPQMIEEQKHGLFKELKEVMNVSPNLNQKINNKRWSDHGFRVPQICSPSNKRSRGLW